VDFPSKAAFTRHILSVALVSVDLMEKTRQPIPAGLAEMPPGPGLAAALAAIDLTRLGGLDCVEVLRAQHRQTAHEQARLMAAMVEVALCGVGPDDQLPRMTAPDAFSADEIRAALSWTRSAANTQLSLAWDLLARLPQVYAALDSGAIDVPKARVFSEWTDGLINVQARAICDRLLPDAPTLTTGQLTERVKRLAVAVDPDWARRRYEEAVRDRKIVGYRNADGTANLCGYSLPADRAAAACAHIDDLAKKAKHAGDVRPIDRIRADLYLLMLDGSCTGWSETDIVANVLSLAGADTTETGHQEQGPQRTPNARTTTAPDDADPQCEDSERTGSSGGQVVEGPWTSPAPGTPAPVRPARRAGVEIRAEVTTLLGLDEHPAEIAGWGPVHADLARQLVREQTAAEWRYAITDDGGRLICEGITRHRPAGYPPRVAAPTRGGIVELQAPLATLRRLAAQPTRFESWAPLLADLARQADEHGTDRERGQDSERGVNEQTAGRGGRSPGRVLRRRTEIRDRTCTYPGCRAPAHSTDADHTRGWADGGATRDDNLGSTCRHDHRLKHDGGWQVTQPAAGHLIWTSRLGRAYYVRPPLIIQPLLEPIPRRPMPASASASERGDDSPIWRKPATPGPEPRPPPPREPFEPPPF
jgi:hypothetical protein